MGKFFKSVWWKTHNNFRNIKFITFFECPFKQIFIYSHYWTCLIKLIKFNFCFKTAAVHKYKSVTVSFIFCAIFICKNKWRVIMVTRSSSSASKFRYAVVKFCSFKHSFNTVSAVKMNKVRHIFRYIKAKWCRLFKDNIRFIFIFNCYASCYYIVFFKYTVF